VAALPLLCTDAGCAVLLLLILLLQRCDLLLLLILLLRREGGRGCGDIDAHEWPKSWVALVLLSGQAYRQIPTP